MQSALFSGLRGLAGGSSLPRLLAEQRGVRNVHGLPPLTEEQVLAWADAHHARTGRWPVSGSGPIAEAPGETWGAVNQALYRGLRGLAGGSSLARLLARERGVRNEKRLPPFRIPDILRWADAHRHRHGTWPTCQSGPIPEAPGDDWRRVNTALNRGQRGLRGGYSLARLLADRRGVRNVTALPPLTEEQILAWADAHRARTGRWPAIRSGPIPEAPGETWQGVQNALYIGLRGLPGGSSIARLLARASGEPTAASARDQGGRMPGESAGGPGGDPAVRSGRPMAHEAPAFGPALSSDSEVALGARSRIIRIAGRESIRDMEAALS